MRYKFSKAQVRRTAGWKLAISSVLAPLFVYAPWGFVQASDFGDRPQVRAYIDELVKEHRLDRRRLLSLFNRVKRQDRVLEAIQRPAEALPWHLYRERFLTDKHVRTGVDFWKRHQALLDRIGREYQVPIEIIVAIVGIETFYGQYTGSFPVVDTLVTLSFDYPRRSSFFRKELTHVLLLEHEEGLDLSRVKSSYAGAMGIGQFIPGSYRAYAVDVDKDGVRDLWGSLADALGSVANYLKRHNWKPDGAVTDRLQVSGKIDSKLLNRELKPRLLVSEAVRYHVSGPFPETEKRFSLLSFRTDENSVEYWAGYQNFYVITRYNRSRRYAMAVYRLSEAIKQRYRGSSDEG